MAVGKKNFAGVREKIALSQKKFRRTKGVGEKDDFVDDMLTHDDEKDHDAWTTHSLSARNAIFATITNDEKRALLRGMVLTRATDNALKRLFLSGDITYLKKPFQGKGFRSLGQEAIYAATLKLHVGPKYRDGTRYFGDVAAPLIRDVGVFLAMSEQDVATVLNAQAGKIGKPCDGRDLHVGDFDKGLLIPSAPLAIATSTLVGVAQAFAIKKEARVALSFIGEGGSSLGEWHEAINCAAVLRLPMVFCIENNQTALSTPVAQQSRARRFADKARGYGIPAMTVDGNDALAIACAFKFAADEARAGRGPILIELITMRMCGHAHHDDMLYLGKDPQLGFAIDAAHAGGYVDERAYNRWREQDPIARLQKTLLAEKLISIDDIEQIQQEALKKVDAATQEIIARPWPRFTKSDEELVFKAPWVFAKKSPHTSTPHQFSMAGQTYLQAIAEGVRRAFVKYPLCRMIGEDVAPPYGNAFMMFRGMDEFSDRFINTPIAENAIVGACVGMGLQGMRPIGEIQFNDFVACAMNQVANNAAKHFFRTGYHVPMVLRLPYGGLRRAGPFHSQDTSPWFYQTPGLKIMAPSTPKDALHMLVKAVDDPDPVLFFEHIALYRDPKIKQELSALDDDSDGAAVTSCGSDITLVSYGAYVHHISNAANVLREKYDINADVIDLRYLSPIDFDTIYASVKKTSRVLLVGEDKKTGGILEMLAGRIAEDLFYFLDAPITVLGARNMPVPYAPSLEDDYLVSEDRIVAEAKRIMEI